MRPDTPLPPPRQEAEEPASEPSASAWERFHGLWHRFLCRLRDLQPLLLIVVAALLAWAWFHQKPWPYSVQVQSLSANLALEEGTDHQWSLEGARVCVAPEVALAGHATVDVDSTCPSSRWQELVISSLQDPVLYLPPASAGAGWQSSFERMANGELAISITGPGDMRLESAEGVIPGLGGRALAFFPPPREGQAPTSRVFRFSGGAYIGDEVRLGGTRLLRDGRVTIHAQTHETASGRSPVDEFNLIPGDRVVLSGSGTDRSVPSRGFVHVDLTAPDPSAPNPGLQVFAFGLADGLRIERYGEAGIVFEPSAWARVSRHSVVTTWVAALLALLGVMAVYREASEIGDQRRADQTRALKRAAAANKDVP